jgi:hypothetical protein
MREGPGVSPPDDVTNADVTNARSQARSPARNRAPEAAEERAYEATWEIAGLTGSGSYALLMSRLFHVTSALNRESIRAHGLDWTLMGAAPGIAGSTSPEADGVFLCLSEFDAGFFVRINNTGGPVDVWAVNGIDEEELITTGSGFSYFPAPIPAHQLTLLSLALEEPAPARRTAKRGTR